MLNLDALLRRLIGEDVEVRTDLANDLGAGEGRSRADRAGHHEPGVNARDAMPQGGKLTLETANAQLDESNYVAATSPRTRDAT